MVSVTYISADGTAEKVDIEEGTTLMMGAVNNGLSGIVAECGGCRSCATCHVFIDEEWVSQLPPADPEEEAMLTMTAVDAQPNSRLSCQITATAELDGIVVHMPEEQ